ncbi:MAG: NHL repeat-containing protein [Deltaproteobacteria bacterium]|nr:NHL repeat-containing protein [Deltaproteobacteria bacterium]
MVGIKMFKNRFWLLLLTISIAGMLCCESAFSMGMGFDDEVEPASVPVLQITSGPLASPLGLAPVYSRQKIKYLLVTDAVKKTVNKLDPLRTDDLEELFKIDGQPLSVAKDRRLIYVGNRSQGSVDVYSMRGTKSRLVRQIKTEQPMQPNDIAIDPRTRQIFVADGLANDVKIFTLSGRLVRSIDGFGDIFDPKSVAIHRTSKSIAVTDSGDPKTGMPASVQVYDYSGAQLLRKTGAFSSPRGVALSSDRLFVADALLGQVLVFNREDGARLGTFGSFGTDPGQLLFPVDIVFDEETETLYVVNNRMGRIVTYVPADFQPVEVTQ